MVREAAGMLRTVSEKAELDKHGEEDLLLYAPFDLDGHCILVDGGCLDSTKEGC